MRSNVPAAAQGSYLDKCKAGIGRCIARCNGGNKFFVGVYEGAGGGRALSDRGVKMSRLRDASVASDDFDGAEVNGSQTIRPLCGA